jgi:pachytene checkpoint protein 2
VLELGLPDRAARAQIVAAALADLAVVWPGWKDLAVDGALHDDVAAATSGWDGRRLRKLPLTVVGADPALARAPGELTADRLRSAVLA